MKTAIFSLGSNMIVLPFCYAPGLASAVGRSIVGFAAAKALAPGGLAIKAPMATVKATLLLHISGLVGISQPFLST
jgi:hypothetical protein